MSFSKIVPLFLLLVMFGLLQNTGILNVYGVKPNLLLVFLIAVSFLLDSVFLYLLLVIASVAFLQFGGGWEWELLTLAPLVIFAAWAGKILPWQPVFSVAFLVGAGTLLFYLAVGRQFLLAEWPVVLGELGYNVVLGTLFYEWFTTWLNSMLKK